MTKSLLIALTLSLVTASAPAVVSAATAKSGKCSVPPRSIRAQCYLDLGGYCDPETGWYWLYGVGGQVLGVARVEACVEQKRVHGGGSLRAPRQESTGNTTPRKLKPRKRARTSPDIGDALGDIENIE
jgi:hypothetical protein